MFSVGLFVFEIHFMCKLICICNAAATYKMHIETIKWGAFIDVMSKPPPQA